MSRPSKSIISTLSEWFRHILAPPIRELSRTGKIIQTLWDAAQLQKQQRDLYYSIGQLAAQLARQGKIQNIHIERMMIKIEQSERILERHDVLLRSYQQKSDVRKVLLKDVERHRDQLDPV